MIRSLALLFAAVSLNHPTGTHGLFLVDKVGAHLRFFDPATFQEQSNIEVPTNPHDFVLSRDHKLAYVPIYGDGIYGRNPHPGHEVLIVDMQTRKVAASIRTRSSCRSIRPISCSSVAARSTVSTR